MQNYKDAAIFFGLLLEYLGLPIPGESLMLMLGFLNADISKAAFSIIAATMGTFSGSMVAYAIGYRYGEKVVLKIGKLFHLTKEKLDNVNAKMRKHAALYVIFSRFVPGVRHIIPYMSGMSKVNVYKNVLYNLLSAVLWCSTFICLGSITGREWKNVSAAVGTYTLIALALIVLVIAAFILMKRYKKTVFIFSAAFTVFILIASDLMANQLYPLDNKIYRCVSALLNKKLTQAMIFISNLGSEYVLLALTVVFLVVLFIKRKDLFYGIMTAVNLITVSLLNIIFKFIFRRARPGIMPLVHANGYSFPSAHSMISAAFYGYLIYLCIILVKKPQKQLLCVTLAVLVFMIGVSRIYLGVHFASDVICGLLAGLSWLVMFVTITEVYHRRTANYTDI